MTIFQKYILGILSILVLSIAYYLVVFLPEKEEQRLQVAEKIRLENQENLQICLANAGTAYVQDWNKMCSDNGLPNECATTDLNAPLILDRLKEYKNLCLKIYPQ